MTSIVVVSAGLGVPSSTRLLADRLTAATAEAVGVVTVTNVELRDLAHQLTNHLLTGFPDLALATAIDAVRRADALIVVTPVFAASYSGLFKTFFDVLEEGTLDGKPVLVAATAGTARHSLVLEHALRPLFSTCTPWSCPRVSSPPLRTSATAGWMPASPGPPGSSPHCSVRGARRSRPLRRAARSRTTSPTRSP